MFAGSQRFQDSRNFQQNNPPGTQFRPQAMSMTLPNTSSLMQDSGLFTEESVQPSQSYYSHYGQPHPGTKVDSLFSGNTQPSQQQSSQKAPADNRIKSEKFFKELQSIFTNQLDRIKDGLVEDLKSMKLSDDGVRKAISSNYEQLTDNISDLKADVRSAVKAFGKKIEDAYKDQETELDRLSSTLRHHKNTGKNKANLDALEGSLKELFTNLTFELEGLKGELATMKQNMHEDRDHIRSLSQTCCEGATRLDALITAENRNHIKFMQNLAEERAAVRNRAVAAVSTPKRSVVIASKHVTPSKRRVSASKARAVDHPNPQDEALFQLVMQFSVRRTFFAFICIFNQYIGLCESKAQLEAQLTQLANNQNKTAEDIQQESRLSEEINSVSHQLLRAWDYLKLRRKDIRKRFNFEEVGFKATQFDPILEFEGRNAKFYPEVFCYRREDLHKPSSKRPTSSRMDIETKVSNKVSKQASKQASKKKSKCGVPSNGKEMNLIRSIAAKQAAFEQLNPRLSYLADLFTPQAVDEEEGSEEEGNCSNEEDHAEDSSSKRDCPSPAIEELEPEPQPVEEPADRIAVQSVSTKKRGRKPKAVKEQELLELASKSVRIMRVKVAVSTPN